MGEKSFLGTIWATDWSNWIVRLCYVVAEVVKTTIFGISRCGGIFSCMKTITKFYFDKAKYTLADAGGNTVLMAIDYKGGKFRVITKSVVNKQKMNMLKDQAQLIAADLLIRKHNVNFSDKIKT